MMNPASAPSARNKLWMGLGLALLLLLAYSPVFKSGFIWDDDDYIAANQAVQSIEGIKPIWLAPGRTPQYYPMVFTMFWAEHFFWRFNPAGYHAVNLLLHGVNAYLFWLLLTSLGVPGASIAALLFAVHPVHVETVAWITEGKNTLSMFFFLASLLAYSRLTKGFEDHRLPFDHRQTRLYAASFLLLIAALLSKTVACSLPVVILLLLWWKRGAIKAMDVAIQLPFFLMGALLAATTVIMETKIVGTEHVAWNLSFWQRPLLAGRIYLFYLAKLLWPLNLSFSYAKWDRSAPMNWLYTGAAVAVIGFALVYSKRFGRGIAAAFLIFAVVLFPALGFVNVYPFLFSYVADHFQYLASLAIIALMAAGLAKLAFKQRAVVTVAVVIAFTALAHRHAKEFMGPEVLWRSTLSKNPHSVLANNNLGVFLLSNNRAAEAIPYFEAALQDDPAYLSSLTGLGLAYLNQNRLPEARQRLEGALAIEPQYALARYAWQKLLAAERESGMKQAGGRHDH